jgi:hypothetical protein
MDSKLNSQFIAALEAHFGTWERNTSRFGNASFGRIAKELCMSPSQFSKLIYGTATEGMYVRAIRNVDRLSETRKAKEERDQATEKWKTARQKLDALRSKGSRTRLVVFALLLLTLIIFIWKAFSTESPASHLTDQELHPLTPFFDRNFNADFHSPYLRGSQVQDFCPCSAFEGEWELNQPYKLPLPANRKPGIYYLAKDADVRMKCFKSDTSNIGRGRVLIAFEYLTNEIWVDTEQTPLSPTYFDKQSKTFTPSFDSLDFENNPKFKRVATIYSFFIDRFLIYPDSIVRKGEPVGRYATNVDSELISEFEIDLKHVLDNVLGDLTQTNCESTVNPFCDPNDLRQGKSVISFDCLYTISNENLGMGGGYPYRKGYLLKKQNYSDNLTCDCSTAY